MIRKIVALIPVAALSVLVGCGGGGEEPKAPDAEAAAAPAEEAAPAADAPAEGAAPADAAAAPAEGEKPAEEPAK